MVSPVVLLLTMLSGASFLVAAAYIRMWRGVGAREHHPWMAIFSFGAAIVCLLRIAQMTSRNPEIAMILALVFGSAGILVSVLWIRVVRTMAGQSAATPPYLAFVTLELVSAGLLWVPGACFIREPLQRFDAAGFPFWGLTPGPVAPVLFLSAVGISVALLAVSWNYPRERATERRILVWSSVFSAVLLQTTYLSATVAPWVPPLGVLVFPLLVLPAGAVLAEQMDDLARTLETRVRNRTKALHDRNRELEAALDRAEAARESQASFLANVSHELRTPLTGVLGMIDLVRRDPAGEEAPSMLRVARNSGKELLGLINELLDAARIEAEMVVLQPETVNLRKLTTEVLHTHEPAAQSKGLRLFVSVHETVPRAVRLDPNRLRQILHNLVGNAVKFTSTGEVRLDVVRDEVLCFQVSDTGPGLGVEEPDELFARFTQADESTTRVYGGTGLGLSIARDLARLMGGELLARHGSPTGAVFELTVPCDEVLAPEDTPTPISNTERPYFMGRVLVVDDDATNRLVVSRMLRAYGVDVEVAVDGRAAVISAMENPPDLVLMDCYMPVLDGFGATRELKNSGFLVPIVALTASAGASDRAASLEAGMDDHLSKPIELRELESILRRYLASRNA